MSIKKNKNTSQLRLERYGQERFIFTLPKSQSNQVNAWKAFINQADIYLNFKNDNMNELVDLQSVREINLARNVLIVSAQSLFQKNKKEKEQAYKFIFMPNKRFGLFCKIAHFPPEVFRKMVIMSLDGKLPKPERYNIVRKAK